MKKLLAWLLALCLLICLAYAGLQISKSRSFQFFGGIVNHVDTHQKVIALTFDDGPTKNTGKILDVLDKLGIKATFFVIGKELEQNLEEGKKIVDAGHELGNHSYSHKRMILKSPSFIKEEIEKTDKLIREAGYKGEIHFRPPNFKKLIFLPYYLKQHNRKTILCDVEPETALGFSASSEEIREYTIQNVEEGSIVLLHIMYDSREEALDALELIVKDLQKKGYEFVSVSQLLEMEGR